MDAARVPTTFTSKDKEGKRPRPLIFSRRQLIQKVFGPSPALQISAKLRHLSLTNPYHRIALITCPTLSLSSSLTSNHNSIVFMRSLPPSTNRILGETVLNPRIEAAALHERSR